MRYRIKHITEYRYSDRVSHCYNLAHMIPRTTLRQKCLKSDVDVQPMSAYATRRQDYFGNMAFHFEIQRPHKKLIISATSEVNTGPQRSNLNLDFGITCAQARELMKKAKDFETLQAREYQLESPMIRASSELQEFAAPSFADDRPLLSAVMDLTRRIFKEFSYEPQSTTIATPLHEVLESRKGVCQDFAHLQIGCLRSLGFAAKYVSGYIETLPPPGKEKLVGTDATHAWISVYSPTEGWFEFDPTNECLAGEQHIITAWGRDFFDVTPLKGVIFGGGQTPTLNVSVDVARLAD
ncbi:transglutaminase family protein [Pseudomaricurvus sp. HS19]|uniref:transglutaminase family protein n=1 Tax=Pseudomaricurvus sp. HS19 TaxID=2692626 RepID=UPI00136AFD9B|nr:transglutaminase family protein [Pseudomaricurvus sp. HS19]